MRRSAAKPPRQCRCGCCSRCTSWELGLCVRHPCAKKTLSFLISASFCFTLAAPSPGLNTRDIFSLPKMPITFPRPLFTHLWKQNCWRLYWDYQRGDPFMHQLELCSARASYASLIWKLIVLIFANFVNVFLDAAARLWVIFSLVPPSPDFSFSLTREIQ